MPILVNNSLLITYNKAIQDYKKDPKETLNLRLGHREKLGKRRN